MNIGNLNQSIILQYSSRVSDKMGGFTTTWTSLPAEWAAVWPISANEIIAANSSTMVSSHRIRIRYRSVIKSSWRVFYNGKYLNIVSIINPNMSNRYLELLVKEI